MDKVQKASNSESLACSIERIWNFINLLSSSVYHTKNQFHFVHFFLSEPISADLKLTQNVPAEDSPENTKNYSEITLLNYSLQLFRKPGSPSSNSIAGKVTVSAKRTTFPQFIRNSTQNNENITFVNEMCTENSATLPVVSRGAEIC
jgi:hypothetical protein